MGYVAIIGLTFSNNSKLVVGLKPINRRNALSRKSIWLNVALAGKLKDTKPLMRLKAVSNKIIFVGFSTMYAN